MSAWPPAETRLFALSSLLLFASCGMDERGLSFQPGTSMSPATAGGSGGSGNAGTTGQSGKTSAMRNDTDAGGAETEPAADSAGADATGGTDPSASGSDSGGRGGNAGQTGTAQAGAAGAPFDSPCGDLNGDQVADCEETLVQNSRFDSAALGWAAEGSLEQAWVTTNAESGVASGSLSLRNTTFMAGSSVTAGMGSRQCLVAWGDDTYELAAQIFIKPGQGSGAAALDLVFFGNDGCDGTVLGGKTAASVDAVGAWRTALGQVTLPAGTRSVWVRLTVGKPLAQASFEAMFDNVLVTKK